MKTGYLTPPDADDVLMWWDKTQSTLEVFLSVMSEGGTINDKDVDNALRYLKVRKKKFNSIAHPARVNEIKKQLLASLSDLMQSLHYRQANNPYQAQLRLDMALAKLDAVRFHLIKFNITI